jgi:hypothetical protein
VVSLKGVYVKKWVFSFPVSQKKPKMFPKIIFFESFCDFLNEQKERECVFDTLPQFSFCFQPFRMIRAIRAVHVL